MLWVMFVVIPDAAQPGVRKGSRMLLRLLLVSLLSLSLAAPAAAAPAPAAPAKKCKKGYVLKTVKVGKGKKARRVKRCVKKKAVKRRVTPAPAPPAPVNPTPAAPGPATPTTPAAPPADQIQKSRDDNVGKQAMASMGGSLLLERAEIGNYTHTYNRMWFMGDGSFQWNTVDWMQEMGEKCSAARRGTWSLKEGGRYSHPQTNGAYAILNLSFDGQSGEELLIFPDAEPNNVYVSPKALKFEKNPQIMQNC